MVYNWDGKESDCYRLYVTEKKSLDEVIRYWEERGFTPSKRAFQTQFKRWEFPTKQNPAHKNPALVARVKELWEQNVMHKDMVDMLHNEGFQINDRELLRLRLRFGWLLRESTGKGLARKQNGDDDAESAPKRRKTKQEKVVPGRGLINQLANSILQETSEESADDASENEQDATAQDGSGQGPDGAAPSSATNSLGTEELQRRQARLQQLQAESDEKWRTRKRRRRTREWGGLPADAPGEPPRYPSETTLDESKAYLELTNELYHQVRSQFQAICEESGVFKKTIAGPEIWTRVKQELLRANVHLTDVFRRDPEALQQLSQSTPTNTKALSLDVICMDVTKRLRTSGRMGVIEAKKVLGLNPDETRQVRNALAAKFKAAAFITKTEAGTEEWEHTKQAWAQESEILRRVFALGDADPQYMEKIKALEITARDVLKRIRNDNNKRDPNAKKNVNRGPGPGPAAPAPKSSRPPHKSSIANDDSLQHNSTNIPPLSSSISPLADLQIDPSLLLAASDPSILAGPSSNHLAPQPHLLQSQSYIPTRFIPSLPQPIYFRLHPHSQTPMPNKNVWLSIMQAGTVAEIRTLAVRDHPGTVVVRVEGLMGQGDREMKVPIEDEDECAAYLEHVNGGKATFVVLLGMQHGGAYHV